MKTTHPDRIALEFVECINNQDLESLVSLMTEGFTMITDRGDREIGREVMKEGFRGYFADYPEYKIHVEKVARSGNDIAIVGKTSGSHIPPRIEERETVIWIARIEDDLVAEWWIFSDMGEGSRFQGV
jgi:uncharacterized protein (TIGR02246 family)